MRNGQNNERMDRTNREAIERMMDADMERGAAMRLSAPTVPDVAAIAEAVVALMPTVRPPRSMLDAKEAWEHLGICERTFRTWDNRGYLPRFKVGGVIRYRRKDLDDFIAKKTLPEVNQRRSVKRRMGRIMEATYPRLQKVSVII